MERQQSDECEGQVEAEKGRCAQQATVSCQRIMMTKAISNYQAETPGTGRAVQTKEGYYGTQTNA
jgi:hypothetical protein